MLSKREWISFFAGIAVFHAFSHLMFAFSNVLPIKFFSINLTQQLNTYAIVMNVAIAAVLFWWLSKTK